MMVLGPQTIFSEMENRVLQLQPEITADNIISGRFMTEFTDYIQDQYWQRSWWVRLKNGSEKMMGKRDINNAFLGSSGTYTEKRLPVDMALLQQNISAMQSLCDTAAEQGVQNWFMVIPSAWSVYPGRVPQYAPVANEGTIYDQIAAMTTGVSLVDVMEPLRDSSRQDLFFATDHHWTAEGAYIAADTLVLPHSANMREHMRAWQDIIRGKGRGG